MSDNDDHNLHNPDPFHGQHPELDWSDMAERAEAEERGEAMDRARDLRDKLEPTLRYVEALSKLSVFPQEVTEEGHEIVQINGVWHDKAGVLQRVLHGDVKLPEPEPTDDEIQLGIISYFEKMAEGRPETIISFDRDEYERAWRDIDQEYPGLYRPGAYTEEQKTEYYDRSHEAYEQMKGIEEPEVALRGHSEYPVVVCERNTFHKERINEVNWLGFTTKEHAEAYVEKLGGEQYWLRLPGKFEYRGDGGGTSMVPNTRFFSRKIYDNPYYEAKAQEA